MFPVPIPRHIRRTRPWLTVQTVRPPAGDEGEGIEEIEALHGPERTGTVERYVFYTHWKPSPEDLKLLMAGGTIEVGIMGQQLAPHGLAVWPR